MEWKGGWELLLSNGRTPRASWLFFSLSNGELKISQRGGRIGGDFVDALTSWLQWLISFFTCKKSEEKLKTVWLCLKSGTIIWLSSWWFLSWRWSWSSQKPAVWRPKDHDKIQLKTISCTNNASASLNTMSQKRLWKLREWKTTRILITSNYLDSQSTLKDRMMGILPPKIS